MGERGFPQGVEYTPVPSPLLGPMLEELGDPDELRVTLRVVWLLHQKKGSPRWVTRQEVEADAVLARTFSRWPGAMTKALEAAVARGTLLTDETSRYTLNTAENRRTAGQGAGVGVEGSGLGDEEAEGGAPAERSNIFALYEDNIGMLSPLIAEQLKEAERQYPAQWVVEAFREAVSQNKRSWRYIQRILERWEREGRGHAGTGRYPEKGGPFEESRPDRTRPFRY